MSEHSGSSRGASKNYTLVSVSSLLEDRTVLVVKKEVPARSSTSASRDPEKVFARQSNFTSEDGTPTTLSWPPVLENLHPGESSSISILGRSLLKHLQNVELLSSSDEEEEDDVESGEEVPQPPPFVIHAEPTARPPKLKKYYCTLEFTLSSDDEQFLVKLEVVYTFKNRALPSGAFISKEQVLEYLNRKVLGFDTVDEVHRLVETLLDLEKVKCYINGLELV